MVRLRTLGTLDLRGSEGSEFRAVLSQPRRLALLVYLAVARPRGFHRRDKLLALFWPDQPMDRARASLSRAIYFLRRELGHEILLSRNDDEIGLDPQRFWCDAAAFEDALQDERQREATELYRGDILPGFFISDAQGFEQWLEAERTRLRERASVASWTLADEEEGAGNLVQAAQWARQGLELSPFREVGLRRLLALLDRAGDRAGAGLAYQQFERHIAEELELSPSPETRALISAIRSRDQANGFSEPPGTGRGTERESSKALVIAAAAQPRPRHSSRRRWMTLASIPTVVVAIAVILAARVSRTSLDPGLVYVAPPENGGGLLAGLGRMTTDRIIQSLASTGLVQVVAPRTTAPQPRETAAGQPAFMGDASRAGTVVSVELHRVAERTHIQAWITDARRRRVVWAVRPVSAPDDSLERAVDEVGRRVAGAVAALTMPPFASWFPIASSPPTFESFQEFAHAVDLQSRRADREALKHLQRAMELDTTFIFAELQLAAAYLSLFESEHADPMIDALERERERLNPLQRHWLDWMLAMKVEDQPAGYRAISAAAELAPDRFLLDVARWAYGLNRPRETIEVLERLGPESAYNGGTRDYWRYLTLSYHAVSDHEGELAAARKARTYLDPPITALSFECIALAAMGKIREIRALLDTALALPPDRGTSPRQLMAESGMSPAQLMVLCAEELRAHGFEEAAMETLARALAWYRAQPAEDMLHRARRFDVAWASYYTRDWKTAEAISRSLLAEDPNNFVYLGFLGTVAAQQGDEQTIRHILAQFDTFRTTLPMPHTSVGYWQSKIYAVLGDEERALTLLAESIGPQGRQGVHAAFEFERMWKSKAFGDFIRPKG